MTKSLSGNYRNTIVIHYRWKILNFSYLILLLLSPWPVDTCLWGRLWMWTPHSSVNVKDHEFCLETLCVWVFTYVSVLQIFLKRAHSRRSWVNHVFTSWCSDWHKVKWGSPPTASSSSTRRCTWLLWWSDITLGAKYILATLYNIFVRICLFLAKRSVKINVNILSLILSALCSPSLWMFGNF